jgi:hypothetical protein
MVLRCQLFRFDPVQPHTVWYWHVFKDFCSGKNQARQENIVKISPEEYQLSVHAARVAGKASQEVVELLARYFSVPKSSVKERIQR